MSTAERAVPGLAARVDAREHALLRGLTLWSVASVALGGAAWASGRRADHDGVASFGRQTLAWGVVDGGIAGAGARSLNRRERFDRTDSDVLARARSLRRTLLVNAALDVGYVAVGVALATTRPRWAGARGDGYAVGSQGLFLLALDVTHAVGFHRLEREAAHPS